MEFRQVKYFLLIAEEKSFAKASQKAFVSQQALSKAIKTLEAELGTLFERNSSGVALTAAGMVLYQRGKQILELVDATFAEMNITAEKEKKTLFLGIPYSLLNLLRIEKLFDFQKIYPNYEIRISEVSDKTIETEVYYNYLDIGIIGAKSESAHFDYHMLMESKTLIAMHKDNPLAQKNSILLKDLRNEIFITATKDYNVYDAFMKTCAEVGFTPRIKQQSGNIDLIKQFVIMNQGIYPCAKNNAAFIRDPQVVVREIDGNPQIYSIYLITRKNKNLSRPVKDFRDYLLEITTSGKRPGWATGTLLASEPEL